MGILSSFVVKLLQSNKLCRAKARVTPMLIMDLEPIMRVYAGSLLTFSKKQVLISVSSFIVTAPMLPKPKILLFYLILLVVRDMPHLNSTKCSASFMIMCCISHIQRQY